MLRSRCALFAIGAGLTVLASCHNAEPTKPTVEADKPFHKELLKAAADYKEWGRVDNEMHWAPYYCRMPEPGKAHFSASKDADSHGQKLYSLFAKERSNYFLLAGKIESPIKQAIVKESWIPEETTEVKAGKLDASKILHPTSLKGERNKLGDLGDSFYPYATKDGKVYKASKQGDLFLMIKFDPKTEGTDAGWVYGTVTADGKKVTSAGKVESCMKCHHDAPHDRLFGLSGK